MNVILNNESIETTQGYSLLQLLEERQLAISGIAVGLNNCVIKRTDWSSQKLTQGDKITIIRATCGG